MLLGLVIATFPGCDIPPPSLAPSPSPVRPAVRIDQTWTVANGEWTFTGSIDPHGEPTAVVLEIGPGPATTRRFDTQLPVALDLTEAGPLTITTREIPDIDEICVRFTATNSAGTSSSTPLCVPHDLPSFVLPTASAAQIDDTSHPLFELLTRAGRATGRRAVAQRPGG